MRAEGHPVGKRELHRLAHDVGIAPVEAARHVGRADEGHDGLVGPERPAPVRLAHVAVEVDNPRAHTLTPFSIRSPRLRLQLALPFKCARLACGCSSPYPSTRPSVSTKRSTSASVMASEQAPSPRWESSTPSLTSPRNVREGAVGSSGRAER